MQEKAFIKKKLYRKLIFNKFLEINVNLLKHLLFNKGIKNDGEKKIILQQKKQRVLFFYFLYNKRLKKLNLLQQL